MTREPVPEILTVGHGNLALDVLIGNLRRAGVGRLVDVRSTPYSRWHPQFNRKSIEAGCESAGIATSGTKAGVFARIFEESGVELDMRSVQVDGTYVKAHQHAAGAPKGAARQTNPSVIRPSDGVVAGSPPRSWRSPTTRGCSPASS